MKPQLALGISILWVPLAFLFDGVTALLLPIKLVDQANPASVLGLISFVGLGAAVVTQPLAGMASDRLRTRLDRRVFLIAFAVPVVAGLWLFIGATSIAAIAAGYLVVQVAASGIQASQQTLIPEHADPEVRGRVSGLKTALDIGGAFLAFTVLGALLGGGNIAAAAAVIVLVLLGALVLAVLLTPPSRGTRNEGARRAFPPPTPRGMPNGFASLVLARFLFLLGTYSIGRFLLLLVADRLGIEPARAADETGGYLALFTLATALTAIPFGAVADRAGHLPVMRLGIVLSAIGIVLFLPAAGPVGVGVAGLVMSIGTAAFVAANWAATTQIVEAEDAGRLMGIAGVGAGGAAACAGLLGPLIDLGGFTPAVALAAVATLLAAVPLAVAEPNRRRQPT